MSPEIKARGQGEGDAQQLQGDEHQGAVDRGQQQARVQVPPHLLEGRFKGEQVALLSFGSHPRAERPSHLRALCGQVEGEHGDGEEREDRAQTRGDPAEDVRLVLLGEVVDMGERVGGGGSLGGRDHPGTEVGLGEGVELVDVGGKLLDHLTGLSCEHGHRPHAQRDDHQQDGDQQQTGRAAPAPAMLFVQPLHRWLQRQREQSGKDQVADQVVLFAEEPQRCQREQDGEDPIADAISDRCLLGSLRLVSISDRGVPARVPRASFVHGDVLPAAIGSYLAGVTVGRP
jgi:hypothetical protein